MMLLVQMLLPKQVVVVVAWRTRLETIYGGVWTFSAMGEVGVSQKQSVDNVIDLRIKNDTLGGGRHRMDDKQKRRRKM